MEVTMQLHLPLLKLLLPSLFVILHDERRKNSLHNTTLACPGDILMFHYNNLGRKEDHRLAEPPS